MAPKAKATKRPRLTPAEKAAEEARQQAFACVRDHFQSLDIVWAKMSGHPWWPAMFFVSWQAVQLAGIALPPGHEKMTAQVPKTRAGAVLEEDAPPVKTCVVMFLDSFNFALLPVEPRTICTYTVHHGSLLKQSLKQAKSSMKASLKRAMARADELLHVDDREFTPVDSPELTISVEEAAALELRQLERRERRAKKLPRRLEMDVSGDPKKSPTAKKRTAAATATRRRRARAKSVEVVDVDGDEESESDVDVETTAIDLTTDAKPNKKRNRGAKRERSPVARKKSPKTINVDETPPSAPREKRVRPRKKLKAEVEDEPVKEEESEEEGVKATPLSWIWTNKTPPSEETEDKEKGEKIKAKEAAPSEDALMATTEAAGAPTEVKHELLWDDNVFVDEEKRAAIAEMAPLADDQTRLVAVSSANKRSRGSMNQSQIRQNLIMGNLDPHTMVQCESYRVRDEPVVGRGRGAPSVEAPYQVVVHPEAVFVCDLHAHLATCEVIGFLGGRWDADNKVLYIQAAFPCRSLVIDGDDGSTDVEMDPGSEIELREIITSAQLEVVGWYHSHPAFAPDPSVRDIENQSNYQQLFQRRQNVPDGEKAEVMEPFVGLIVGTYDTKRDTPVSLFRYFHVRGEKVNSAICREIFWPFELVPKTRHYRSVLEDETRRTIQRMPMYPEVLSWAFRGATKWSWRKPLEPGLAADAASPEALEGTDPSVSLMTPSKKPTRKRSMSGDNGSDRKKKGSAKRRGKPAKNQGPAAVTVPDVEDGSQEVVIVDSQATECEVSQATQPSQATEVADSQTTDGVFSLPEESESRIIDITECSNGAESQTIVISDSQTTETNGHPSDAPFSQATCVGDSQSTEINDSPATDKSLSQVSVVAESQSTGSGSSQTMEALSQATSTTNSESMEMTDSSASDRIDSSEVNTAQSAESGGSQAMEVCFSQPTSTVDSESTEIPEPNATDRIEPSKANVSMTECPAMASGDAEALDVSFAQATSTTESESSKTPGPKTPASKSPEPRTTVRVDFAERTGGVDDHAPVDHSKVASLSKEDEENEVVVNSVLGDIRARLCVDDEIMNTEAAPSCDDDFVFEAVEDPVSDKRECPETISSEDGKSPSPLATVSEPEKMNTPPTPGSAGESLMSSRMALKMKNEAFDTSSRRKFRRTNHLGIDASERAEDMTPGSGSSPGSAAASEDGSTSVTPTNASSSRRRHRKPARTIKKCTTFNGRCDSEPSTPAPSMEVDAVFQLNGPVVSGGLTQQPVRSTASAATDDSVPRKTKEAENFVLYDDSVALQADESIELEVIDVEPPPNPALAAWKTAPQYGMDRTLHFRTSLELLEMLRSHRKVPKSVKSDSGDEKPTKMKEDPAHVKSEPVEEDASAMDQNADTVKNAIKMESEDMKDADADATEVKEEEMIDVGAAFALTIAGRQRHLTALRTKYGSGSASCVEQVLALVDYYRDFNRRTDINEMWKAKIRKVDKIEASLSAYVVNLNLPAALRQEFVEDIIRYLQFSWDLTASGPSKRPRTPAAKFATQSAIK